MVKPTPKHLSIVSIRCNQLRRPQPSPRRCGSESTVASSTRPISFFDSPYVYYELFLHSLWHTSDKDRRRHYLGRRPFFTLASLMFMIPKSSDYPFRYLSYPRTSPSLKSGIAFAILTTSVWFCVSRNK